MGYLGKYLFIILYTMCKLVNVYPLSGLLGKESWVILVNIYGLAWLSQSILIHYLGYMLGNVFFSAFEQLVVFLYVSYLI